MIRRKTDFANVINELVAAGIPLMEMSRETGLTQPAFSAIRHGRVNEPAWSVGDYLIRKHAEVFRATP